MKHRFCVPAAGLALSLALAACGGGGGDGGTTGGGGFGPSTPPSIDGTRVVLGSSAAGGCSDQTLLDANGNATLFWCQQVNGSNQLVAARVAAGAAAAASAVIEQGYTTAEADNGFTVKPVGNDKFVMLDRFMASGSAAGTRSRVITAPSAGGNFSATAAQLLHADITAKSALLADGAGQMHLTVNAATTSAGTQGLGGGLSASALAVASPFATIDRQYWLDGAPGAPSLFWGVFGKASPSDVQSLYVSGVSLSDGSVAPVSKISNDAIHQSTGSISCFGKQQLLLTSGGNAVAAWLQLDELSTNCDLYVQGRKVNASASSVGNFAVTTSGNAPVAVWQESKGQEIGGTRVRWSRFDTASQTWSTPAAIDTSFEASNVGQYVEPAGEQAMVSGPNGTLALMWSTCKETAPFVCQTTQRLVSKYSAGVWSTYSIALEAGDLAGLAINASGQGVAYMGCTSSQCQLRSLYRF